jgi:hypothetical protein
VGPSMNGPCPIHSWSRDLSWTVVGPVTKLSGTHDKRSWDRSSTGEHRDTKRTRTVDDAAWDGASRSSGRTADGQPSEDLPREPRIMCFTRAASARMTPAASLSMTPIASARSRSRVESATPPSRPTPPPHPSGCSTSRSPGTDTAPTPRKSRSYTPLRPAYTQHPAAPTRSDTRRARPATRRSETARQSTSGAPVT